MNNIKGDKENTSESAEGKAAENVAIAIGLRDFFLARNGEELSAALRSLNWDMDRARVSRLEYEFNRLFVGPAPPAAPPWASVYLEKESRLMGEAAVEMRRLCRALGLAPTDGIPEDWLPIELELWLVLSILAEEEGEPAIFEARKKIEIHALSWIPFFIERLKDGAREEELIFVAERLEEWLETLDE